MPILYLAISGTAAAGETEASFCLVERYKP